MKIGKIQENIIKLFFLNGMLIVHNKSVCAKVSFN